MKIVISGGGFSGRNAVKQLKSLYGSFPDTQILLFDKNDYTTMIPSLPDVAGDRINGRFLTEKIKSLIPPNVTFIQEKINKIDLSRKIIHGENNNYTYDYLVLATGSVTNFYGFNQHLENIHTLDTLEKAELLKKKLKEQLKNNQEINIVIVGGGYTGIELACELRLLCKKEKNPRPVYIVEKAPGILGAMPDKIKKYVFERINNMGISVITGKGVEEFNGKDIKLTGGDRIENVFLCWCAGTKFAIPEMIGNHQTIPDGRIIVNPFLQLPEHKEVFVCGDSAAIRFEEKYLRKAVNFAIYSGTRAGKNLRNLILKKPLHPFKPVDLGWVIPLCTDSIGKIFNGITIKGNPGLRLHYFMCGYRNYNFRNFIKYVNMAFKLK